MGSLLSFAQLNISRSILSSLLPQALGRGFLQKDQVILGYFVAPTLIGVDLRDKGE